MFADNQLISHRQLFRQMVVTLLGSFLLCMPGWEDLVGRRGILSVGIAVGLLSFAIIYMVRLRGAYAHMERSFGKVGGVVFVLCYLSYLMLTGIFLLLLLQNMTSGFLIEGVKPWIIMAFAVVICYMGSAKGLERRGRMAEVCYPVLFGAVLLLFFLAIFKINPNYLQEAVPLDIRTLGGASYGAFCGFAPFVLLPFTLESVQKPGSANRSILGAMLFLGGIVSFSLLLLQGTFGIKGLTDRKFAMVDLMRGVNLPGNFLERVDVFWMVFMVFSILFALGSVFFYQNTLLKQIGAQKGHGALTVLVLAVAVVCEKLEIAIELYGWLLRFIYVPLFLGIGVLAGILQFYGRKKS